MNENLKRERQLTVTVEAATELNRRQIDLTDRMLEPPRPGDVFLSRRAAEYPVEWLMIEEAAGERARVVPVDEHPYTGSLDLELSPDSLGGAGVVRCDLDAWLDGSQLDPELRTGALTELELGRVRRKRRAIERGTLESSLLEEVVDGDPEYVQWRSDTLQPALDALTSWTVDESEAEDKVPSWRRWRFAIAAVTLLALALPLGWQAYQLSRRLDREQVRVVELEKERRLLAERLAAAEADRESIGREVGRLEEALSDAMEASKRALAEQQERIDARLRAAFDRTAVVNVPSYVFGKLARTRSGRGEPEVINPGGAGRFTLSLEVPYPEPYLRYRLRIVDKADGGEVWKTDDLVKVGGKWLRLDLPTDLFETGEYELRIYGLGSDGPNPLKERYVVKVER